MAGEAAERSAAIDAAVRRLRSPETVAHRCGAILAAGREGELEHFVVHDDALPTVVERVVQTTRRNYPDLEVPVHGRWGHFRAGGIDRVAQVDAALQGVDALERARIHVDLVVASVLLDAGAGPDWRFVDDGTTYTRSEGLAVATVRAFQRGFLSARSDAPLRVDGSALRSIDAQGVMRMFDAGPNNPLVGLDGRAELLRRLGDAVGTRPEFAGRDRPGGLVDFLQQRAGGEPLPAATVLEVLLEALQDIWPGRVELGDVNLGDVWPHPRAGGQGPDAGLVPLHKLSTWLTYSLIEPLGIASLRLCDLDVLPGLAEYRNGGLLVDLGLLALRDPQAIGRSHRPQDPLVIEWRALTVALLQEVAVGVRAALGLGSEAFPMTCVLQGGTWAAGREVARERRPDGTPPITIDSDGTVF